MDKNNIKIGTIGKFTILPYYHGNKEAEVSGVIIATPNERRRDEYVLVTTLGKQVQFDANKLKSFTSTRIPKEVRVALTDVAKQHLFVKKLEKEKEELEDKISDTRKGIVNLQNSLTHLSGFYTSKEVENKAYAYNFRISGSRTEGKAVWLNFQQSNDGERYSKPDVSRQFPFIYQEYDGVCFLREELAPRAYKEYLSQNAPEINPTLKKLADEVTQEVDVGDKYIYATTNYWVKFKNGLLIEDVDKVYKAIKG